MELNVDSSASEHHVDTDTVVTDPTTTTPTVGNAEGLRSIAFYRKELRGSLDPAIFKPNPRRLVWYFGALAGALLALYAIVILSPAWPLKIVLGLAIGCCTGTLGFVFHEISHGSVIANRGVRTVLGFFGALPYLTSPTYWAFSHDRLHHGRSQKTIHDPDAFPTLRIYRSSRFVQFVFPFTPGSGHKRSLFYFFFWFSFHNMASQVYLRFRNRIYDSMNHRRATIELVAQIVIMTGVAIWVGPSNWLYVFLIPFAVQNYMLMSYISTNHNMSPLTSENDPLVNSLSVTNHPILEFLNLNFGYHVEHHLFPTVNGRYAKQIHRVLAEKFPDSYKIMPKSEAIRRLYRTPRIYQNSRVLVNPETMETAPTI